VIRYYENLIVDKFFHQVCLNTDSQTNEQHRRYSEQNTNSQSMMTQPIQPLKEQQSNEELRVVHEPYNHLTAVKGKEVRAQLIDAFNVWLQVNPDDIETIKSITDKLHNASLL
jgi:hypothetical protein